MKEVVDQWVHTGETNSGDGGHSGGKDGNKDGVSVANRPKPPHWGKDGAGRRSNDTSGDASGKSSGGAEGGGGDSKRKRLAPNSWTGAENTPGSTEDSIAADNTTGSASGDKGDSEKGTNKAETEGVGAKRPMPDRWGEMTRNQRKSWKQRYWRDGV